MTQDTIDRYVSRCLKLLGNPPQRTVPGPLAPQLARAPAAPAGGRG
ncbi:Uncharacterised protein [Bordetella ansorpii]|uniref:Uncharacterized protein n=1 Tax=Bordetella ansorpii TaxID=288768 RepID=A0A157S4L8_9BORD|nr:hypothetical protein [Bordetella ansorpii]SAI65357.1 Uncharacterised protein [Bordetella ansorpii]